MLGQTIIEMATKNKKTIVITGAAGGIGTACAKALKEYKLVMTDYSEGMVSEVTDQLIQLGYDAVGIACDITQKEDIADVVTILLSEKARFITGSDILVDGCIVTQLLKSS